MTRLHILWLKTELLHPIDKGGRIRTYHMLRALTRAHRVTYLTLDDGSAAPDAVERASEYCDTLVRVPFRTTEKGSAGFYTELLRNVLSPLPYAVWKYRSPEMREAIEHAVRDGGVDVVVCDFLFPSVNVGADLGCPTVLFQHNVEAKIWERHYAIARHPLKRAYLREQWRRMGAFEAAECRRHDAVIAVSVQDRDVMRAEYGVTHVIDVPTGVDTAYFRASDGAAAKPLEIVFTGSMDWMPNEDGITYFVDTILPIIRRAMPAARLTVVGRHPTPRLLALAAADPGLSVTGSVPDVRPYLERASVVIVPLRVGGGTRLKIYEAMAMERPVVSTSIGAEGLPVEPGAELVIADDPAEFAAAVIALLTDRPRAQAMAARGAARVRQAFGWDRVAEQFADICARAARRSADLPVRV